MSIKVEADVIGTAGDKYRPFKTNVPLVFNTHTTTVITATRQTYK